VEEKDMVELVTRALYYLQIHLLYASVVWSAAWALTSILPGSATTKYWIWVATSLNFIVPAGALIDALWASRLEAAPLGLVGEAANRLSHSSFAPAVGAAWLAGAILMLRRVCLRIRSERREVPTAPRRDAADPPPDFLAHGVPVRFAEARQAPSVSGILRPRISLPAGIERLLSPPELDAVLAHELTHARRRDNLIRLVHEIGLCALWFHPLVWLTGLRIALYRELSCDESVIQNARGRDLVSALAKLAAPEETLVLQASVSSFLGHRVARLAAGEPRRRLAASALLIAAFGAALLAGSLGTVSHTACCFVERAHSAKVAHCKKTLRRPA
jgi:beta-lactamase regulating signal transducer with metallopeptidase domain